MLVLNARNVEEAWALFLRHMQDKRWVEENCRSVAPRKMTTVEVKTPVCTTYSNPAECVLFDPLRDANPFFHLYEALWILNGNRDVERLARYLPRMKEFSDNGHTFNAPYGWRLRNDGEDQLLRIAETLRNDPDSRRGVLQIWKANDLTAKSKDLPCNTAVFLKIREGKLRATVLNRSNDAVWGCFGANAVQFPIILQYLAAAVGVGVGELRQVSDSLHVYTEGAPGEVWRRCSSQPVSLLSDYSFEARGFWGFPLIKDPERFLVEVDILLEPEDGTPNMDYRSYAEPFLIEVAIPMFAAHAAYREEDIDGALTALRMSLERTQRDGNNEAWLSAGLQWMQRRSDKRYA